MHPLEHLAQLKQVFCEIPVSKVRNVLSSLVLIHPSAWKGESRESIYRYLHKAHDLRDTCDLSSRSTGEQLKILGVYIRCAGVHLDLPLEAVAGAS